MSSAATCPKCHQSVSLPSGIGADAWVRCPLCSAKYQYRTVLDALPPMLELVAAPFGTGILDAADEQELPLAAAHEMHSADEPSFEESTFDGGSANAEFNLDDEDETPFEPSSGSAPIFGTMAKSATGASSAAGLIELGEDEDTLPAMEAGSLATAAAVSNYHDTHGFREAPDDEDSGVLELQTDEAQGEWQSQPPVAEPDAEPFAVPAGARKKRKSNSILEIVKFAAAGVLGLTIGYFVLLWAANIDLFNLAEVLPPFMVPASMRPAYQLTQRPLNVPPVTNPGSPDAGDETDLANQNSDSMPDSNPMGNTPMGDAPMGEGGNAAANPSPDETPTLDGTEGALPGINPAAPPATPTAPLAADNPPATNPFDNIDPPTPPQGATTPQGDTPMPQGENPMPPAANATNNPPTDAPPPNVPPANPLPDMPAETNPPVPANPLPSPFDEPAPKADPGDAGTIPPPDAPQPMAEPSVVPTPPAAQASVGPKSDTRYTLEQVNQAMAAAGESIKQLANAPSDTPDADLKRLMAGSYRSFAELAEEITLLNDTPENTKAARAASLALLQSNVVGMRKLNLLGRMASFGMNSPHRKGNGVVLAARVDETAPEGKLFRTRVKLLGLDLPDSISILSAEDPQVKPTDTIVLLGSIVAAPTINLHDYSGTEDSVIWATAIGPAQLEP